MPRKPLVVSIFALCGTIVISAVGAGVVYGSTRAVAAPSAAATVHAGGSAGTLTPEATVDPLHAAAALTQPAASARARGARPLHGAALAHSAAASTAPRTVSAGMQPDAAGVVLHNFNGVGSLDSAVTNFGAEFEPPDQGLCAGNGFVVEPVNSAYTIYRANGAVVAGPFNVNALFDEGFRQFTSDPRCYFDQATNTWFAIILFINAKNTASRTDLAVSTSADPTKPWTVYRINTTDDGTHGTPNHAGCPCFGDQPLLGIDQENVYISTNEFSILGPQVNSAQIYAISKADLVALAHHIHFVHFDNLNIAGVLAQSVQPALSSGRPDAEYFLNSLDPNGSGDNRLGVWAMTNRHNVSTGHLPTLSSLVIASEPYFIPPGVEQKGLNSTLDAGDDRMQQTQYINGGIWGELGTTVLVAGDGSPRAGAAWFRVHPQLAGAVLGSATLTDQGYLGLAGHYLIYPALQANAEGSAVVVMTLSGPDMFPSVAYAVLREGQHTFGAVHLAASGTGAYDPNATRWGDYSWAVLDPDHDAVWLATEYIPPLASQTTDGLRNWGTRVLEVSLSH
ncbi:MAG: hypothetical protein ACHQ4H_08425 [Ktedonobacterales bacterium]